MEVLHILMGFAGGGAAVSLIIAGHHHQKKDHLKAGRFLILSGMAFFIFVVCFSLTR